LGNTPPTREKMWTSGFSARTLNKNSMLTNKPPALDPKPPLIHISRETKAPENQEAREKTNPPTGEVPRKTKSPESKTGGPEKGTGIKNMEVRNAQKREGSINLGH